LYELDDLLQESYFVYARLVNKKYKSKKHFFATWKKSLHNMVTNLGLYQTKACRDKARVNSLNCTFALESSEGDENIAVEMDPACKRSVMDSLELEWRLMVEDAPNCVQRLVFNALTGRTHKLKRLPLPGDAPGDLCRRETTNSFLCRVAGVSSGTALRKKFEAWIRGDNFIAIPDYW
jgi:hypothetical protein